MVAEEGVEDVAGGGEAVERLELGLLLWSRLEPLMVAATPARYAKRHRPFPGWRRWRSMVRT
jgi:hypothetical protein